MDDVLDDSGAVPGFGGNSSANAGDDGPNAHAANPGMGDVAMVDAMAPPTSTHSDGDGDSLAGGPMGGDNLRQFPVLVGAGLVNWKAHVLKLGRELALGVDEGTAQRLAVLGKLTNRWCRSPCVSVCWCVADFGRNDREPRAVRRVVHPGFVVRTTRVQKRECG